MNKIHYQIKQLILLVTLNKLSLEGDWDGDKDSWPHVLNDEDWSSVVADTASYCGGSFQNIVNVRLQYQEKS